MTKLLYLSDTYQATTQAKILDIHQHEKGTALILDQTIFYPQGGGQPCDQGTIKIPLKKEDVSRSKAGGLSFHVHSVILDPEGLVWHIGDFEDRDRSLETGLEVDLHIDMDRRLLNARCHTAGHLIDIAVAAEKDMRHLVANKGFHFPQGPYVEYQGEIENPSQYIASLEQKCQEVVERDIPIITQDLSSEQAQTKSIKAPPGKSARFVYFEGSEDAGCGCGGTHVKSTSEIDSLTIRKISSKKGVTRVAYQIKD